MKIDLDQIVKQVGFELALERGRDTFAKQKSCANVLYGLAVIKEDTTLIDKMIELFGKDTHHALIRIDGQNNSKFIKSDWFKKLIPNIVKTGVEMALEYNYSPDDAIMEGRFLFYVEGEDEEEPYDIEFEVRSPLINCACANDLNMGYLVKKIIESSLSEFKKEISRQEDWPQAVKDIINAFDVQDVTLFDDFADVIGRYKDIEDTKLYDTYQS